MRASTPSAFLPPVLGALLGGSCVGIVESLHVLSQAYGTRDYSGMLQAVLLYGGAGLILGLVLGLLAVGLALLAGAPPDPSRSWTLSWLLVFLSGSFLVSRWVISRDAFLGGPVSGRVELWLCVLLAVFGLLFYLVTRNALKKTFFGFLLHPLGTGAVYAGLVTFTLLFALGTMLNNRARADVAPRPVAPSLLERPNLLLVVVEDLRIDDLGEDELARVAPHLAALRDRSWRYQQAYAHSSWSRESLASVFSSQVPCAHGALGPSGALPEAVDTVAEALRQHGYTTGAVLTDADSSASFNFNQGFDTFTFLRPRWLLRASEASYRLALHQLLHRVWRSDGAAADRHYRGAGEVAEAGVDWLRRHGGERWFLTLQFRDLGEPLVPHPELARRVAAPLQQAAGGGGTPEVDRSALYRGELASFDEGLGALLAYMDEHDLLDRTAVLLTGTQGPGEGELSEERLHVPLLLRLPDAQGGGRDLRDLVSHIDLAPTLTELAGASEGRGWEGASLLREYELRRPEQRRVWFEAREPGRVGLRDGRWKLVREGASSQGSALYYLEEDPLGARDLAALPRAAWKLAEKRDELAGLEESLCRRRDPLSPSRARQAGPSPEDCEVLRRLGYEEGFSTRCLAGE